MVKEKPYNLIIEPDRNCCYLMMAYSIRSGNVKLPRMGWFYHDGHNPIPENVVNLPVLIRCFSHEILTKWLHENEGLDTAKKLDNVDVRTDSWGRRIFTGAIC